MKYVKEPGPFDSERLSILETIQEIEDVTNIAISLLSDKADKNSILAVKNLKEVDFYIKQLEKKTKTSLANVPDEIKEKYFL